MQPFDHHALLNLLNEYAFWYQKLAKKGPLPRALSGINAQGAQFLIRLDDINLSHPERHGLIRTILSEEQSVCYAYGGVLQTPEGERLTLVVATRTYFVMGEWKFDGYPAIRFEQTELWEGDNPEEVPGAWFLTDAVSVGKQEVTRYQRIWQELRQQAMFMQRPEEDKQD